jgi:phosphoglycolate phosphatase-like HAD superfamily hydrolase
VSSRAAAPRPFRTAIFDFEGTLVDFQWRLANAERELRLALARLGLEGGEFATGNYATLWNTAAARYRSPGQVEALRGALCPIYDRWDADALSRWTPRPGAVLVLQRLATAGCAVGMVSNIGRAALGRALERFGFARWLQPVVSRDDVSRMKPDAEGILGVLREWNLPADEVLFVGDSRADVLAARASGLAVAIVRGGECSEADFADAPPDFMLSRLDEIPDLVRAGGGGARDPAPAHPGRGAPKCKA